MDVIRALETENYELFLYVKEKNGIEKRYCSMCTAPASDEHFKKHFNLHACISKYSMTIPVIHAVLGFPEPKLNPTFVLHINGMVTQVKPIFCPPYEELKSNASMTQVDWGNLSYN